MYIFSSFLSVKIAVRAVTRIPAFWTVPLVSEREALSLPVWGETLRTLVWGQFGYEKVTGAASVWKHLVLPARWPLWESTNRSKWFQMRVWTRARAHAPTPNCWKQCQHWEDLADCVSPRALIHSRHGTVLVLDAVCCYKYMFSL